MTAPHGERKHAKYSASSMERLEACPGSAAISEGLPDKSSPWAEEGTKAHEVLEMIMKRSVENGTLSMPDLPESAMMSYGMEAARFILGIEGDYAEILIENKCDKDLAFIHRDAGGSLDYAIIVVFDTLHIIDYKFGAGHIVSPVGNLQMVTYAIAIANRYHWNFKRIRMWIIQPRIKGYDGPVFWEIPTMELKDVWLPRVTRIIERAETEPETYVEGGHCHWCKANKPGICPLKTEAKLERAKSIFTPVGGTANGKEETNEEERPESEADWRRKEKDRRKGRKVKEKKTEGRDGATDFY